jgi:hypothetical protein
MFSPRCGWGNFIAKIVIVVLAIVLCTSILDLAEDIASSLPTPTPRVTSAPTPTAHPDDPIGWAKYYASQYDSRDVYVTDVRLINSQALGQDVCFIVDLRCDHSDTALQFSHLNEFMINICEAMSSRSSFDCVSFTVYDKFVDKYGNAQSIVSITASYKVPTLRLINYDYHMSRKYSTPTAFISCADSYYIHPGYDLR